jgi:hypothetical protein
MIKKNKGAEKVFLFTYPVSPLGKGQGQALPLQSRLTYIPDSVISCFSNV